MRLNRYIASSTLFSRRKADELIAAGRVLINGEIAKPGAQVEADAKITLDGILLRPTIEHQVVMLNKPAGYVCSRNGQGSKTIYDLLPPAMHHLQSVGRLDKDSSGLLLLTNDGSLAQQLTHPKYQKAKVYLLELDTPLQPLHHQLITGYGVTLRDGSSRFEITRADAQTTKDYRIKLDTTRAYVITIKEGRNRQIRRTFSSLGYTVSTLHRVSFGHFQMNNLSTGTYRLLENYSSSFSRE